MANMLCRTKGNASPKGKPRVYFTCHPADFEKCFDKVCEDIFEAHDCAVYYTEDMTESIPAEDLATDLGSNNLFVIPVTFKLLTQPNRAMDEDFIYARQEHIPVLPFMMEPGIDECYAKPDKFGKLQYLNPSSSDDTEVPYKEKLKKYLESVLISDQLASRVRAAFDAYIFLSYRKKDRRYANELMRLIHRNPECRDIAVWYDEFLTPGESFQESIEKILHSSKLFALLVTPNLLEEPNGNPNFVMAQEYPAAKASGIHILPAEMESTDKAALGEKFRDIPECVDAHDERIFRDVLLAAIQKAAITTNNTDLEHNFLIGLAYLDGIDVEVDRERGIRLITDAAENNLPEAMKKLYELCTLHADPKLTYREAIVWAERLASYYAERSGEEDPNTITWINNLAFVYSHLGDYSKALHFDQKAYSLCCKAFGEDHPQTIPSLNNLAATYYHLGRYAEALPLMEKAYTLCCQVSGQESSVALSALRNLAATHGAHGNTKTALELHKKSYSLCLSVMGEEHPQTLRALGSLAAIHQKLGNTDQAIHLLEKAYTQSCKVFGQEHPSSIDFMINLAAIYHQCRRHAESAKLQEAAYDLSCKVHGPSHPITLTAQHNLAVLYQDLRKVDQSLDLLEEVYMLRCQVLGKAHPDTLLTLSKLAESHARLGDSGQALIFYEELYDRYCEVYGKEHLDTISVLEDLIHCHTRQDHKSVVLDLRRELHGQLCAVLGKTHPRTLASLSVWAKSCERYEDYQRATELLEEAYDGFCSSLGEEDPHSLITLHELALSYINQKAYDHAIKLLHKEYTLSCKVLGQTHRDTLTALNILGNIYKLIGDRENALRHIEKAYQLRRESLGEMHIDTIASYTVLSRYYHSLEMYGQEVKLHEQMLAVRLQENGPSHPMTKKLQEDLTLARQALEAQQTLYRENGCCQHCGGNFTGLFRKKCKLCGKPKDY